MRFLSIRREGFWKVQENAKTRTKREKISQFSSFKHQVLEHFLTHLTD